MGENGPKWLPLPLQASSFNLVLSFCLAISLSQSFFHNLHLTIFPWQSFVQQSFLHNHSFTFILSQSFFHILSFTIFLSQSFFHNLFSQSLQNLGRIVVPSGTCFVANWRKVIVNWQKCLILSESTFLDLDHGTVNSKQYPPKIFRLWRWKPLKVVMSHNNNKK